MAIAPDRRGEAALAVSSSFTLRLAAGGVASVWVVAQKEAERG
jgi:hypothetical protein